MRIKLEVRPLPGRAAGDLVRTRDWVLTRDGVEVARFALKKVAVMYARQLGREIAGEGKSAELTIKNGAGRIATKDSYGFDPKGGG